MGSQSLLQARKHAAFVAGEGCHDRVAQPRRRPLLITDYRIRAARREDLHALAAIERDAAKLFLAVGLSGDFLEDVVPIHAHLAACDDGRLWVAVDEEDGCVGFALVSMREDGAPLLEEIDVHPAHGRRGLGRRLVAVVAEWARVRGFATLTLSTFRDVPWNAALYARLGFVAVRDADLSASDRELRREEAARGLPVANRVVMRLDLATSPK